MKKAPVSGFPPAPAPRRVGWGTSRDESRDCRDQIGSRSTAPNYNARMSETVDTAPPAATIPGHERWRRPLEIGFWVALTTVNGFANSATVLMDVRKLGLDFADWEPAVWEWSSGLMMLALVGTLAYEFSVVLPLMARGPLDGGPGTYGLLTSAMGAGAVVGGLVVAGHGRTGLRPLTVAAAMFGAAILATAAAPTVAVALVALTLVGAASVTFLAVGNSTLQLTSDPRFRGRVMALWTVAFLGSTPVGAPIIGWVSEVVSPRGGLVVGGLACLAAAAVGAVALAREHGGGARHQPA